MLKELKSPRVDMDQRFEVMLNEFQKVRRDVAVVAPRCGLRLEDIFRQACREALQAMGLIWIPLSNDLFVTKRSGDEPRRDNGR